MSSTAKREGGELSSLGCSSDRRLRSLSSLPRCEGRLALCEKTVELHIQGFSHSEIAMVSGVEVGRVRRRARYGCFVTYYTKRGGKWVRKEKWAWKYPAGRNPPRLAADLSRRHSGDCGLSRLNGSADGRPLQPEAIGPFGSTRLSYCGTDGRPLKIS